MDYTHTLKYNVVGLGVYGGNLVVCTEAYPAIISGLDPAASVCTVLPYYQPCTSKKSILSTPFGVSYASHQGLFLIDSSGGRVVTAGVITPDRWQAESYENIVCAWYKQKVFAFVRGGSKGFIYDFSLPDQMMPLDLSDEGIVVAGLFVDEFEDALYIMDDTDTSYRWEAGSGYLGGNYHTPTYMTPPVSLSAGRVDGDFSSPGSSVSLTLFGDGEEVFSSAITSSAAFRVACGRRCTEWSALVEPSGGAVVHGIHLATSMGELALT